jgi:hypothetical protein
VWGRKVSLWQWGVELLFDLGQHGFH